MEKISVIPSQTLLSKQNSTLKTEFEPSMQNETEMVKETDAGEYTHSELEIKKELPYSIPDVRQIKKEVLDEVGIKMEPAYNEKEYNIALTGSSNYETSLQEVSTLDCKTSENILVKTEPQVQTVTLDNAKSNGSGELQSADEAKRVLEVESCDPDKLLKQDDPPSTGKGSGDDSDWDKDLFQEGERKKRFRRLYKCEECDYSTRSGEEYSSHCYKHKTGVYPFVCDVCGRQFMQQGKLKKHLYDHMGMKLMIQCEDCNDSFEKINAYQKHVKEKHRPLYCAECNKGFPSKSYLKKHVTKHSNEKPFACYICEESFKGKEGLGYHFVRKHPGQPYDQKIFGDKPPKFYKQIYKRKLCETCGKTVTESKYKLHMATHTTINEALPCEFCNKTFRHKYSLRMHVNKSHRPDRTHECDVCNKSFKTHTILRIHKLIHEGVKKHKCRFCSKEFTQGSTLRYHLRTHTGETPFACEKCPQKFKFSHHLKNHIKKHHK